MRGDARVSGLLGPPDQHLPDAGVLEPPAAVCPEPDPVGVGQRVGAAGAQVDRERAGAGRGKDHQAPLARSPCPFQRHEPEDRVLNYVGREGTHRYAEQFGAADALAAQDADDRVVAGRLEIPGPAVSRGLEEVVDELARECLRPPLDRRVAVQPVGIRSGDPAFLLKEVEQLDQVALQGVRPALAVLQVVLAEVAVEQRVSTAVKSSSTPAAVSHRSRFRAGIR